MLDFNRVEFNKSINLSINKKIEIESKYPLVKLGEKFEISKGKSITQKETIEGNVKVVAGGLDFAYLHNISNRPKNIITISASGANAGYVNFWNEEIFASDCTTIYSENITFTTYAYNILKVNQNKLFDLARGSAQPHVYPKDIENFKIPFPELEIQEEIVKECQKVDDEVSKANEIIEQSKQNIENGFLELFSNATHSFKLSNDDIFDVSIGRRVLAKEIEENPSDEAITVYSANVFEPFGYIKKDLLKDFSKDSVLWGIDGDWMVNFIPKEKPFYPTDHCGVVRIKQNVLHGRYLAWALNKAGIEFRFSRANRASTERIKGMVIKPGLCIRKSA